MFRVYLKKLVLKKRFLFVFLFSLLVFSSLYSASIELSVAANSTQKKVPLQSHDNNVYWDAVLHDSRDSFYRSPGWGSGIGGYRTGAVPVGTDVVLRLRTAHNDLTSVQVRVWDGMDEKEFFVPMHVSNSTSDYDYWEATISSPSKPDDYYYNFALTDGTDTDWYNDDSNLDGGTGVMENSLSMNSWGIVFYDPNFVTPAWHRQSIGYQIFIDSFYNGDPTNDAKGNGQSGDILWFEWDSNGDWKFTPEDAQRVYATKKEWNQHRSGGSDYFGGDLAGIIQKIDYLKSLGISEIWFNPFTESPDNHGYSVDNYYAIDPYYGAILERDNGVVKNDYNKSMQIFEKMVSVLKNAGINVFYDTVINHVSAQSVYFQRFESNHVLYGASGFNVPDLYPDIVGAYENPYTSPYYDWFKFYTYNHDYDAWWGFKNIPTLKYDQTPKIAEELITGPHSLFTYWIKHGVMGFRLDVNPDYDDGHGSRLVNRLIRERVKQDNPDAVIIGEVWDRANTWLTGTMNDGVQNMPFRKHTIDWLKNPYSSDKKYINFMLSQQENYPLQAFLAQWTILGNHDTARILTELKENSQLLKLATVLQFTYPGVPMIYYGDEIGMSGASDPDNRNPFTWDNMNIDILSHYKSLINLRRNYSVFVDGGFSILPNNFPGVITFARELPSDNNSVAITVVSKRNSTIRVNISLDSLTTINEGDVLSNVFNPSQTFVVSSDKNITLTLNPYGYAILMINNTAHGSSINSFVNPINSKSGFLSYSFYFAPIGFTLISIIISRKRR